MKTPSWRKLIWGNPLTLLLVLAAAAYVLLPWLDSPSKGEFEWLLPVIMVVLVAKSVRSAVYIRRYKKWQKDMDAFVGEPGGKNGLIALSLPWRLFIVFGILTMLCGWMLFDAPSHSKDYDYLVMAFAGLSLGFAGAGYSVLRGRLPAAGVRDSRKRKERSAHIVSVCLPVPKISPVVSLKQLPPYCVTVLKEK